MRSFSEGSPFLFMKVGTHAREPFEQIVERKSAELRDAGMIFWGYGGNTCHPETVRAFAKHHAKAGRVVQLAMHRMNSNHLADPKLSKDYSDDGVVWRPVPKGIQVLGSKYALVLGSLEEANFELDLDSIRVACGASQGRLASDYIRGHVDKGCFEIGEPTGNGIAHPVRIGLVAKLIEPYAVFLK